MKKALLLLVFFLTLSNFLHSEEKFRYENTSWNVIQEQFFDGTNSRIFRYEDDVRFELIDANPHDSLVVQEIVDMLSPIIETVRLEINPINANFIIDFDHNTNGTGHHVKQLYQDFKITSTKLSIQTGNDPESIRKLAQFYILRNLTKVKNTTSQTRYEGIFDSDSPNHASLHEIDLDIIKKIYSANFYDDFKQGTIKLTGGLHYLQLRYRSLFIFIGIITLLILSVILFNFLLTSNRQLLQGRTLKSYLKDGFIILLVIYTINIFFLISFSRTINLFSIITFLLSKFVTIIVPGLLSIIAIFYLEKIFKIRSRPISQHLMISGITTLLTINMAYLFIYSVVANAFGPIVVHAKDMAIITSGDPNIIYTSITVSLIRTFFLFFQHRNQSLINQKDVALATMTTLKKQAELSALHARINPHFLYNSLNSIAGLAESEPRKVQKMAMALSDLFRYAVNKENDSMVNLNQEIEMVKRYLEIEQTRFGDHLDYSIHVDEETREIQIPKFLIQPLVENAIKHGVSNITEKGLLKIQVLKEYNSLIIKVFDNGPDFPEDLVSGYGLQNLNDKLDIIYQNTASISWKNGSDKHISITLKNQF